MTVIFSTSIQTTLRVNWGDGNIQDYTFGNQTTAGTSHLYPNNLYTATYYNLKFNGVCDLNATKKVDMVYISDIIEESEFANLPSVVDIILRESEVQSFTSSLPPLLKTFSINGNCGLS